MTEKELQKLKRSDLLEILVAQGKEIEVLREEKDDLEKKLKNRTICIENAGTIAEAAVQLNGVFEAAQAAAEQYLESVQSMEDRQKILCAQMERETAERCETLERETTERCEAMLAEAQKGVEEHWMEISQRLEMFYDAHCGLRELLKSIEGANFDEQTKENPAVKK